LKIETLPILDKKISVSSKALSKEEPLDLSNNIK
jgi:hypothetical protein